MGNAMDTLNRQIYEFEESFSQKQHDSETTTTKLRHWEDAMSHLRHEKDAEIATLQEGIDATIQHMQSLSLSQGANDEAVNAQIDTIILDNTQKLNSITDSILQARADKVDDALC